tara:strand:- start:576 stop:791 length:216 start_codon:yes stop_codon:yes gene_type:complete
MSASSVRRNIEAVIKAKKLEPQAEVEKVRARDEDGHFIADNPETPENEAWVEKKPAVKKAAPKKAAAKKKK